MSFGGRLLRAYGSLLGLAIVGAIVFGLYYLYDGHSSHVSFQEYRPTVLPEGVAITGQHVEIWTSNASFSYQKLFRLELNQPHSSIGEERAVVSAPGMCAANQICGRYTSPQHQPYHLAVTYDRVGGDRAFAETVSWVRNGTYIWIDLRGGPLKQHSPEEWGRVIDSFEPIHYGKIEVDRDHGGP